MVPYRTVPRRATSYLAWLPKAKAETDKVYVVRRKIVENVAPLLQKLHGGYGVIAEHGVNGPDGSDGALSNRGGELLVCPVYSPAGMRREGRVRLW